MMIDIHYPAKLLLLGEYTVLKGSSALAVPYHAYYGQWSPLIHEQPSWLKDFIIYLLQECTDILDAAKLSDIAEHWTFDLTIPIGYGLGSSGALVAATYDYAALHKTTDTKQLMITMGRMESFFHGTSSGFDPLVSYLRQGIRKLPQEGFLPWPHMENDLLHKFELVDSGSARSQKKDLIPAFLTLCEHQPKAADELIYYNNSAIEALIAQQEDTLITALTNISQWQWIYMQDWISPSIRIEWESSIGGIYKICGAGGGGFYLRYAI